MSTITRLVTIALKLLIKNEFSQVDVLTNPNTLVSKISKQAYDALCGVPVISVDMPPFYDPLRCYQDESIYFIVNENENEPCDTIITLFNLLEESHNTINIFPNPTKDHLNIKFKEPCNSHIVIYDLNGNALLI